MSAASFDLTAEEKSLLVATRWEDLTKILRHIPREDKRELKRKFQNVKPRPDRSTFSLTPAERERLPNVPDKQLSQAFPGRGWRWLRDEKREERRKRDALYGQHIKGESILYDAEGHEVQRWVKTAKDKDEQFKAVLEAAKVLAEPFRAALPKVAAPKATDGDLLVVYPMGDPHVGMYAWAEEAGEAFDLEIATSTLVAAVDKLTLLAPPAKHAMLLNLGDFYHFDNYEGMTRRSGNVLDTSGRYPQVIKAGIECMKQLVRRALERHESVTVVNLMGNHDDQSALFLSFALAEAFSNNPRVKVDTTPTVYKFHRFGKVLLGMAHGNEAKREELGQIMAADRAKDWGETEFRYWYTGHIHHRSTTEVPGCEVESFRTLAARDAYHTAKGYRSGRDMKCIIHHRNKGEVLRHTVGIGELL